MDSFEKNDVRATDKAKKPYESPKLTEYGDLSHITQTSHQPMGLGDNSMGNAKTGP